MQVSSSTPGMALATRSTWWRTSFLMSFFALAIEILDKPGLHLLPGPFGFPEKRKTRFDGRIHLKTADWNPPSHFLPTISLYQHIKNVLQGDPMQRIRMRRGLHKKSRPLHRPLAQVPLRRAAGEVLGFSFFGFLTSFF